jgi:hypothetical protein
MRIKYGFYKEISVASEFSHSLGPEAAVALDLSDRP